MQRRHFLRYGGAAAVAGALGACGQTSPAAAGAPALQTGQRFRWTCSMAVPRTFPLWAEGISRFAKHVAACSGDRLQIEVIGINDKIKGLGETFEAVKQGRIEMAHAAAYYWYGKSDDLQAAPFFTSVPFGMDARGMSAWLAAGGGQELWDELYAAHGLKPFPCGNTGVQAGGWFRQPINNLADFQGLKMRIPGFGGQVLARVGANPENIPAGDIFLALQTGRIDATEWVGPFHDQLQKFHQVASYYYTDGWHEPGSCLELTINKAAWDGLPADLQAIVAACAAEADAWLTTQWTARDSAAFKELQQVAELQIQPYPAEVIEGLKPHAADLLAEVRDSSPLAKRIHDSYRAFQKQYGEWFDLNSLPYYRAWDV